MSPGKCLQAWHVWTYCGTVEQDWQKFEQQIHRHRIAALKDPAIPGLDGNATMTGGMTREGNQPYLRLNPGQSYCLKIIPACPL